MDYRDLLRRAQNVQSFSFLSKEGVEAWNALEDHILGKMSLSEVDDMVTKAKEERLYILAAGVLLTMAGE